MEWKYIIEYLELSDLESFTKEYREGYNDAIKDAKRALYKYNHDEWTFQDHLDDIDRE